MLRRSWIGREDEGILVLLLLLTHSLTIAISDTNMFPFSSDAGRPLEVWLPQDPLEHAAALRVGKIVIDGENVATASGVVGRGNDRKDRWRSLF